MVLLFSSLWGWLCVSFEKDAPCDGGGYLIVYIRQQDVLVPLDWVGITFHMLIIKAGHGKKGKDASCTCISIKTLSNAQPAIL